MVPQGYFHYFFSYVQQDEKENEDLDEVKSVAAPEKNVVATPEKSVVAAPEVY